MKILTCIKQVPDSGETLEINPQTGRIAYKPLTVFRMNRFDEFALEEALLIRERLEGSEVHAVSVGPERVGTTIRRALEMGADHGIHILTPADDYLCPFTVASLLASRIRSGEYDVIMTGVMAEDDMEGQTGQILAALLDLPCASSVIRTRVEQGPREIAVEREIEGGRRLSVLMEIPAVLTIQPGINTPRYPSLSHVMRARRQPIETIPVDVGSLPEPQVVLAGISLPDTSSQGVFLQGSAREKAREMTRVLHEKSIIL